MTLRIDHRERVRQFGVGLVVIGDDQIHAQLARAPRRFRAADSAVHGHDQADPVRVQPLHRDRLQTVAVLQPLGDEMRHLAAEQLNRAPQDDRGRDAIDVVVAVDGDALLAGDRGEDTVHCHRHVSQRHRIVQMIERGVKEPRRRLGISEAALTQQPRHDQRHRQLRRQPLRRPIVAGERLPARGRYSACDARPCRC